jgi:dinuclear metal center YbgI/SA1388 family protein
VGHLNTTLGIHAFRDYGPNGLQVEGRAEVRRIATGVSASLAFLEAAAADEADLVVVHHGLIWGSGIERLTGALGRRVACLLSRGMSLLAYHLPLDVHVELGNNAGFADALGLLGLPKTFGDVRGHALGWALDLTQPLSREELIARVSIGVLDGAPPRFVFPWGRDRIRRVGLCTGAASDLLEDAARAGCDAFVTGELAERAGELAREVGITLIAAGHYATEVYGPRRLVGELSTVFPQVTTRFIDILSPL